LRQESKWQVDSLNWPLAHGGVGQAIGLGVVLAGDVGDGEAEGTSQLAARPVQRIEAGATADVLAAHLADYDFGIGIDVQGLGVEGDSALQGFHEGNVFGDVVILVADPLGDADGAVGAAIDDDSNAGGPRVSLGTAVHIGYEFCYHCWPTLSKMRRDGCTVKMNLWFSLCNFASARELCKFL